MTRRCPHCGRRFRENPALHVEVPYLAGPGDLTVWACIESEGRHVRIPLPWWEDFRRSVRSLRATLRRAFGGLP